MTRMTIEKLAIITKDSFDKVEVRLNKLETGVTDVKMRLDRIDFRLENTAQR